MFILLCSTAYAYNCDFQNGKNDEMNRKFYEKYCALVSKRLLSGEISVRWCNFTPFQLGDLLSEFSSDYEIDVSKVSQFINTCIEQALVSFQMVQVLLNQ